MIDVVTVVGVRAVHFIDSKGMFCGRRAEEISTPDDVRTAVQSLVTPLNVYYTPEPMHGEWAYNFVIGDALVHLEDSDEGISYNVWSRVEQTMLEVRSRLMALCDETLMYYEVTSKQLCVFNIWQAELGL